MRFNQVVWLSAVLASLTARAEGGTGADALKATLEQNLMKPLAKRELDRSRFSRAAEPPAARRVRLLDAELKQDARGQQFATFAIDARYEGGKWVQNTIVGCIYPQDGSVYIQRGANYQAAAMLLGKKTENPPQTVCRAKTGSS